MEIVLLFVYAYLVGSIPTAYIIGKLVKGIDIREYGSGNVGGSNLLEHVGRWWIVPHSLFEVFVKGASPVWLGIILLDVTVDGQAGGWAANFFLGLERNAPELAIASLLTIVGHNWPIFLKFQGGRGIGPAAGGLFAMAFYQLLFMVALWLMGILLRRSAAMLLVGFLLLPVLTVVLGQSGVVAWYCLGMTGLIVLRRLTANGRPRVPGYSTRKVLFNRLVRDRDVDSRDEWVQREPTSAKDSGD